MLEETMQSLTTAIQELTATMKGGKAAGATKPGGAPATKASTTPKITFEQVKAAVVRVKDEAGKPAASKIIKEVGMAADLSSITPPHFPAVIAACEAILSEAETEEDDQL